MLQNSNKSHPIYQSREYVAVPNTNIQLNKKKKGKNRLRDQFKGYQLEEEKQRIIYKGKPPNSTNKEVIKQELLSITQTISECLI